MTVSKGVLTPERVSIKGTLSGLFFARVSGKLSSEAHLKGGMSPAASAAYDIYTGEYTVTPQAENQQVLKTGGKLLSNDITVKEVPYYETHNLTGTTVFIAGDVDYGS